MSWKCAQTRFTVQIKRAYSSLISWYITPWKLNGIDNIVHHAYCRKREDERTRQRECVRRERKSKRVTWAVLTHCLSFRITSTRSNVFIHNLIRLNVSRDVTARNMWNESRSNVSFWDEFMCVKMTHLDWRDNVFAPRTRDRAKWRPLRKNTAYGLYIRKQQPAEATLAGTRRAWKCLISIYTVCQRGPVKCASTTRRRRYKQFVWQTSSDIRAHIRARRACACSSRGSFDCCKIARAATRDGHGCSFERVHTHVCARTCVCTRTSCTKRRVYKRG